MKGHESAPAARVDRRRRVTLWAVVVACAIAAGAARPVAAAPTNDDFAGAAVLVAGGGSLVADNTGATRESGEPSHAGDQGGASLWYAWTPSFSGPASIDTAGSSIDTLLGVYTGSSVSALTTVGSNDDISSDDTTSRVCFSAVAATTYMIAVDGYDDDEGSITLDYGMKNDAAPCATLPPKIGSPSPKTGDSLGSAPGTFAAADGAAVSYQWGRCVEQLCTDIDGATNSSYTVQSQDVGYGLRLRETVTTGSGSALEDSAPTMPVSVVPATHANGRIYFVTKTGAGSFRIDSMLADGTGLLPLTAFGAAPNFATEPAISPDGSKVAFVNFANASHIELMNPDGSGVQDLGVSGTYPTWSPDGSRVAFLQGSDIDAIDRSGGSTTPLVSLPSGAIPEGLRWSPDGTKLAFDMYVSGAGSSQKDIMVVSADGTGSVVDLTDSPATDESSPSWSPTGRQLAFDQAPNTAGGGQTGLSVMDADGANPTQLYSGDSSHQPEFGTAWSPDGTKILFSVFTNGTSQLYTVPPAGGPATPLPVDGYQNELMTWGVPFTPSGGGGGGGGGAGGGGGGGGGAPNTKVTVTVQSSPHNVGDAYAYAISLVNNGGGSSNTTLTVNLPTQTSYNGAVVDRGPGCTSAGTTVTCSLDFFPGGQASTVLVGAKVNSLGTLVMTTSVRSSPSELNADGSVTTSLTLGGGTAPTTSPAPSSPQPAKPSPQRFATLTLFPLTPVLLHAPRPSLHLKLKVSKATALTFTLRDKNGRKLAIWHEHAAAGNDTYTLHLPADARKPGHDILQVAETGETTHKTLGVTLKT